MANHWCFVVGPIGESGSETRKRADLLLELVIRPALAPLGFDPIKRADDDADPGSISDALIKDVLEAPLVVADLTDFNPNAFYELGIRHASRLPTIHIIAQAVRLPFDNQDQRTIFVDLTDYQSIIESKHRVEAAAEKTLEKGYSVSNPVTRAKAVFEVGERRDPRDEVLSALNERMIGMERTIDQLIRMQLGEPRDATGALGRPNMLGQNNEKIQAAVRNVLEGYPGMAERSDIASLLAKAPRKAKF